MTDKTHPKSKSLGWWAWPWMLDLALVHALTGQALKKIPKQDVHLVPRIGQARPQSTDICLLMDFFLPTKVSTSHVNRLYSNALISGYKTLLGAF